MKKFTATSMVLLFLMASVVAFVPTAAAQKPTWDFSLQNKPTEPITPFEESHNIKVSWSYILPGTVLQAAIGQATGAVTAEFTVVCTPAEIVYTGDLTQIIAFNAASGQNAGTITGEFDLTVTPTRNAPGLEPIQCSITGKANAGSQSTVIQASDPKTVPFTVTPDFFSLIEASAPVKLAQGGPQKEVPFTIDVTNFGNAQTRVKFEFVEGATPGGKWQGLLPDQLILDRAGGDQAAKQAIFTVSTPFKNGWNNDQGSYTLVLKPEYALNAEKVGSEVQITILTRVRGVYVPSLEPLVMVGAVLGSAMLFKLRKDTE